MKEIIHMTSLKIKNLNKKNTTIIIGNPGCGKTTKLISHLSEAVNNGTPLNRIAYCSFSVAAIEEALDRAIKSLTKEDSVLKKQDINDISLKYFKTLHAMAFHLLDLSVDNLLTDDQLQEFSKIINYPISYSTKRVGLPQRALPGDKLMHIINVSNLNNLSIRDYCVQNKVHEFPIRLVEDIAERYSDFKMINSLYDYTDMLIMAKTADLNIPDLDYLFIDEAQDLSTLQWMLVDRLAEKANKIIIAGDDKQSINEFAGADVDTFLSIQGKVEVLEQSYRIPRKVFRAANTVMKHMIKYRPEGSYWNPRNEEGELKRIQSLPVYELLRGDWLILSRTGYQLEKIREKLINASEEGAILFTVNGAPPIDLDIFRVVNLFKLAESCGPSMLEYVCFNEEDTADIRACKVEYIKLFKKYISCDENSRLQPWEITEAFKRKLTSNNWIEAVDKLTPQMKRYIRGLYPRYVDKGEDLFKDAKIRLMTIHASKGREADNVIVMLDVPRSVKETIQRGDSDVEVKTLYVAMTRARKKLYLYSKNNYDLSLSTYLK